MLLIRSLRGRICIFFCVDSLRLQQQYIPTEMLIYMEMLFDIDSL